MLVNLTAQEKIFAALTIVKPFRQYYLPEYSADSIIGADKRLLSIIEQHCIRVNSIVEKVLQLSRPAYCWRRKEILE